MASGKPPLLRGGHGRAWVFVSHATQDIRKVRLIRNYLERAGAEPILFRLKLLDARKRLIGPLLKAEIQSRQFFLLCQSRHARRSKWVRWERREAHRNPKLMKYVINLDQPPPPWSVPRAAIDTQLRHAFINLGFAWADRAAVYDVAARLKTGVDVQDGERRVRRDTTAAGMSDEPMAIDHGFRTLDDRPRKDGRSWSDAAIAASEHADTIVLCVSRRLRATLFHPIEEGRWVDVMRRVGAAYRRSYVIDLDGSLSDEALDVFMTIIGDWRVMTGSLPEQLHELVGSLKADVEWVRPLQAL